jgi:hypothetical protein
MFYLDGIFHAHVESQRYSFCCFYAWCHKTINCACVGKQDFELLCTDGTRAPVASSATCNWGKVASHTVMTSMVRSPELRASYKTLLLMLSADFGQDGLSNDLFQLFESISYGRQNLLFTDETVMLKDTSKVAGGSRDSYYAWAGKPIISLNVFTFRLIKVGLPSLISLCLVRLLVSFLCVLKLMSKCSSVVTC